MATPSTPSVKLVIEVSQSFIDIAAEQTNTRCPVALSLKNVDANRIQRVKVDRNTTSFSWVDHDIRYTFKTPVRVRKFIDAFDNGGKVQPFTFTLDTVDAIDAKPIIHPSARTLARQSALRADVGREMIPRTKWSGRVSYAK